MKKLALILPLIIALAACGGGASSSSSAGPTTPPTPPAGTPNPATGQWVIVTQSTVMPGQNTIANFDMSSVQVTTNGYQFGVVGSTPIPAAITPNASFGWTFPECIPYGGATQNCPTVDISGFVGVITPNAVSVTITGSSSNITLEQTVFSGTMNTGGTTMTGTYEADVYTASGQPTQTDSGSFFATVLSPSSVNGSYVGTVAVEHCNTAGANCSSPLDASLSLTYTGTLSAPGGTVQFTLLGNNYTASLNTPASKSSIGGLFNIGLTASGSNGAGTLDFIPGVTFSVPPVANPSSNTLLVDLSIPNGGGIYAIRGFLTAGNVPPGGNPPSIGATESFTFSAGVITQAPLVNFSPATPVASATFCASGCSQLGLVAAPVSLSITIGQPVTQGYLRVFVLDTSASPTGACPPPNQITACSFMNYPGNGIYIGDFSPGGVYSLQGVIPGGNTIEPTDNLEVVIVNLTGSWTGTVSWQLNYQ